MSIFMDWYLLDRDLPEIDLPPIKYYTKHHFDSFSDEEKKIYHHLCQSVHSIFRLKRFTWRKNGFVLTDLFSKKTYKVLDPGIHRGFSVGDIFEIRLIPFRGGYELSKGVCFHPKEMESFILKEIKKVRYQEKQKQTKLILQLSAMKLNHLRFSHIDVRHIYSFDSKF